MITEKNVPARTTLTAVPPAMREQKTKIVLNISAAIDEAGLDQEVAQYLIHCCQDRFRSLIERMKGEFAGLKDGISKAIAGQRWVKLDVKGEGLIAQPYDSGLSKIGDHHWIHHTTHFNFNEPGPVPTCCWGRIEDVCSVVGVSSKLVGLVWRAYRADDVIKNLLTEDDARKERVQIITDLLPFPKIAWDFWGIREPWRHITKRNMVIDHEELRKRCLKSKRALRAI